ncbi:hypothetical protein QN357_16435, partial [Cryobacterium sp. RTC2.1]|uniref:hypothetical protein n=1 Tax=Cryobacterium sp. RTC2.1 TaxID=3048634 RepID=UPI002B23BC31
NSPPPKLEQLTRMVLRNSTTQRDVTDLLFPSFQFGPDGEFLPSLDRVLKALGDTLDDWSIALWIVYRDPQDGISNFERLRSGDAETVVQRATRRAEILRH